MNLEDPIFSINDTLRSIKKRHSIRNFNETDVPEDHIAALLKAANEAPSAHNQQPWRFIVLKGEKKQELAQLVSSHAASFPKPASALLRMASKSIMSAPVVIAISNTGELIERGMNLFKLEKEMAHDFFRTMEIQSSAAAAQNLLLAATSLGLATVWLGILFLMKDSVLQFLGEPAGEFMAVVPVGYAAKPSSGPQKQPVDVKVKYLV
ncbi:MAG TPA: nitroreductase family protein [Thermodesulfovibrionales bacterium]|nr:nitroreductase family protein [Thermodesulfovibrionales bacterium]